MINSELIQIANNLFCFKSIEMDNNTYLLVKNGKCIIIDPSFNFQTIDHFLTNKKLKLVGIILTHCHYDHSWAVSALEKKYACPIYAHEFDKSTYLKYDCSQWIQKSVPKIKKINWIHEVDLTINGFNLQIVLTPGHTSGSICVNYNNYLFTGDTLFTNGIGRFDFPNSNFHDLKKSLDFIYKKYPPKTLILPGHGDWNNLKFIRKVL